MGLREEKKRETRHAIVDTALGLFREHGFTSTRIQDVAARLRISEGTFFNYFPTKQSVLEAVASDLIDRSIDLLERDVVDQDRPVPERLEEQARTFARSFEGDRELVALLASHTDFFSGARSERLERARGLLVELFAEGQARGEIRADVPPAQLADMLMAVSLAMVHSWVIDVETTEPLEERLLRGSKVVIGGCRADAQPAERTSL
jgi:AcrR family transcriptional regulator